jgi:parallel beta-helix repeat protein
MLTQKTVIATIVVLVLSISTSARATHYYVDPNGDDSNGLSWATAFHAIQQGIDANSPTVVEVNEATYYETVDFNGVSCTVTSTDPNDPNVVAATIIDANGGTHAVYFHNSEDANSVLTGFYITGATDGVRCSSANPNITKCDVNNVTFGYNLDNSSATISGCTSRNNSKGVRCWYGSPQIIGCLVWGSTLDGVWAFLSTATIKDCVIENNGDDGIDAFGFTTSTIMYNYIGENTDDGIVLSTSKADVKNNWIYDNGNAGIRANGSVWADLWNNTIVGNSKYGILNSQTQPTIRNCIIWDCNDNMNNCTATYSCISDCNDAGGTGNICGDGNDPNFVDPNNDDYHLAHDSPCIDKGYASGDYTGQTDIDGEPRVQGEYVDMGADEVPRVHNVEKDKWYATIQAAINDAADGNTIVAYPGSYQECIDFVGKAITVRSSDPNDWDIVDKTVIDANGGYRAVYFHNSEDANSVLRGFTITDASHGVYSYGASPTISNCVMMGSISSYGIRCQGASPTITNCIAKNNYIGSYFTSTTADITNCIMEENTHGIFWYGSPSGKIGYNKIRHNTSDGIYLISSAPKVNSNSIYDNGRNGVTCLNSGSAVLRNNAIVGNDTMGICKSAGTQPSISNCILWDCNDDLYNCSATYSCISDCNDANGTGNLCGDGNDPNFVDPNNDDYHVAYDSPCIDKGDPNGDYTGETDIDGEPRVQGVYVDIGADEVPRVHNIEKDKWYVTVQAAIDDACDSNTIEVHQGTYSENIDFGGKAIMVRSTDPNDSNVVAATIIDGGGSGNVVEFETGETSTSVLEGLTITDGNRGIYCYYSSPTISKCVIKNNTTGGTDDGAGMYNDHSDPNVLNCTFSGNSSADDGGGMHNYYCDPTISGCDFNGNTTEDYGGGMRNENADATISNCKFVNNTAGGDGGGMYNDDNDPVVITDCVFIGNSSGDDGGGMFNEDNEAIVDDCVFAKNAASDNGGGMYNNYVDSASLTTSCVFWDNNSVDHGGGIANRDSDHEMANCTFFENEAGGDGGAIWNDDSDATIANCIFWQNSADGSGDEIYNEGSSNPDTHDNFEDDPDFEDENDPDGTDGVWGTCDDGLRLDSTSDCIDEGDTDDAELDYDDKDIKGSDRELDSDPDIGAYEYDSGC